MGSTVTAATGMSFPDLILVRITEVAFLGALYLPMAVYRTFRIRKLSSTIFFVCFHIVFALLSLIGIMMTEYRPDHYRISGPSGLECLLSFIPTCALLCRSRIHDWDAGLQNTLLFGLSVITLCSILILIVRMWPQWRAISALEKNAAILPPAAFPSDAAQSAAQS
jgi:hypothetical protein